MSVSSLFSLSSLLLLLPTASLGSGGAEWWRLFDFKEPNSRIAKVVETCCPKAMEECCKRVIDFYQPLNCTEELRESKADPVKINLCIQRELFSKKGMAAVNIQDATCCFAQYESYDDSRCTDRCLITLFTPGLSAKQKMRVINDCKEHQWTKSFNGCRVKRRLAPVSLAFETECISRILNPRRANYMALRRRMSGAHAN